MNDDRPSIIPIYPYLLGYAGLAVGSFVIYGIIIVLTAKTRQDVEDIFSGPIILLSLFWPLWLVVGFLWALEGMIDGLIAWIVRIRKLDR